LPVTHNHRASAQIEDDELYVSAAPTTALLWIAKLKPDLRSLTDNHSKNLLAVKIA